MEQNLHKLLSKFFTTKLLHLIILLSLHNIGRLWRRSSLWNTWHVTPIFLQIWICLFWIKYIILKNTIPIRAKFRIGQNPELDKVPNSKNSEMNKIPNWTKSRTNKIPSWTKSRIGQNPELDKIPSWTKSPIGQNPELENNPNWTKSAMDKIWNRTNFKDRQSQN